MVQSYHPREGFFMYTDIRNIAIVAHVDHGKTTLVDGMLKQTHTFRDNQAEMQQTTILDSNELEREKGITILAKNTAVFYHDIKINIIDTPGHADFGGEVERVLNMADAALLVVDAAEGPLPQTRFVLEKALLTGLKIILVINKIDKKDARPKEVLNQTEELFLKLATHTGHLEFPVIYTIGREGRAGTDPDNLAADLTPLFDLIIKEVPNAVRNSEDPVQMLISTLDFDNHLGKLGIGRIRRGKLEVGQKVTLVTPVKNWGNFTVEKLFTSVGIRREEITEAQSGDIVALAGVKNITIGQTICDPQLVDPLPEIKVEEPTMKVSVGPNTSPFAGKEGKYVTGRKIEERLLKEAETNLGMKINQIHGGKFEVIGRGELHLAILFETMRREGYEMEVSKPQVIFKDRTEPFDEVVMEVADEYVGAVTTEMGRRRGEMRDMKADQAGYTRLVYRISQRNMIGARNILLTQTRGTILFSTLFLGFFEMGSGLDQLRNGVLVSLETGKALSYSLEAAQQRGTTFVESGEEVYQGMIIGLNNRESDIDMNVCRGKHLTNTRSANKDMKTTLSPAVKMSLEQALDFIEEDELLEITPLTLRLRKKQLTHLDRVRHQRANRN